MDMDVRTFSLLLIFVLVILQGILWAWVGLQAKKLFPWWPFLRDEEPTRYDDQGRYRS